MLDDRAKDPTGEGFDHAKFYLKAGIHADLIKLLFQLSLMLIELVKDNALYKLVVLSNVYAFKEVLNEPMDKQNILIFPYKIQN